MDAKSLTPLNTKALKRFSGKILFLIPFLIISIVFLSTSYDYFSFLKTVLTNALSTGVQLLNTLPSWSLLPALGFLPLIGVPISPLYVLTGLRLSPAYASLTLILGIGINLILSYLLARGPLRRLLSRTLPQKTQHLNLPAETSPTALILWVRLSPLPFLLQNLTLGALKTPLPLYMALSWPIQLLFGLGFAFAGTRLRSGHFTQVLLALFFILSLHLFLTFFKKRRKLKTTKSTT